MLFVADTQRFPKMWYERNLLFFVSVSSTTRSNFVFAPRRRNSRFSTKHCFQFPRIDNLETLALGQSFAVDSESWIRGQVLDYMIET